MDALTLCVGIALVMACITTVEAILWSYTIFAHCRWIIKNNIPDRRNISYNALSVFSGITALFWFVVWLMFVFLTSIPSACVTCTLLVSCFVICGHILCCHMWHLVSSFINIPLEFVPYTSRFFIRLSNIILTHGYRLNSFPLRSWEEFYSMSSQHRTLIINFLEACPDMFWTKTMDGVFTYINQAASSKLFKTTPNNVINRTTYEVIQNLHDTNIVNTFGDYCEVTDDITIDRLKPTTFLETGMVGDNFLALRVIKSPIIDQDQKVIGIIGVGRDVTMHVTTYEKMATLFREKKYKEAEATFLEYKQKFDSFKNIRDPELIIGVR